MHIFEIVESTPDKELLLLLTYIRKFVVSVQMWYECSCFYYENWLISLGSTKRIVNLTQIRTNKHLQVHYFFTINAEVIKVYGAITL